MAYFKNSWWSAALLGWALWSPAWGAPANLPKSPTPSEPKPPALHTPAAEEKSPPASDLRALSQEVLGQVYNILLDNALAPPKPTDIFYAYTQAMATYLKEQGLDGEWLAQRPLVAKELERFEVPPLLNQLHQEATSRYPQLQKDPHFTTHLAQAIMESAQDPYTVFLSLEEYRDLDSSLTGDYSGSVGLTLAPHRDGEGRSHFVVASTAPQSPAREAGLEAGDELLAIDGRSLEKLDPQECALLLRGTDGSKVQIRYQPADPKAKARQVTLERTKVHYPSASAQVLSLGKGQPSVGLLTVEMFTEYTNIEAERALRQLEKANCRAYILDLRQNPGGYTNAARDLCSKFLPQASLVAQLVGKGGKVEQSIYTYRNEHPQRPLIVLVDGRTASAAELSAGALRAVGKATLVGAPTYGKNSSQRIFNFEFPPGETSACKVTYSHYKTPDGLDLGQEGLQPQVLVEMDPKLRRDPARDLQLQKALQLLKEEFKRD